MQTVPRLISADDHVVEPPTLWADRLPSRYRDIGPRVTRERVAPLEGSLVLSADAVEDGEWADVWCYEDKRWPLLLGAASAGIAKEDIDFRTTTFDEMRPGCYDPAARLTDMDTAGIEASLCFPNIVPTRFCGQGFLEAQDKDLALLCVRAYNDFILDEWCSGSGGRLISCCILPLWDGDLAAEEAARVAARGCRAICFSEAPAFLGLPSIHTPTWDRLFATCAETEMVVMIHVGSSSHIPYPSADAPKSEGPILLTANAAAAMVDWLFSGVFERYPSLKMCLAECQIGWIPYYLQHCDDVWNAKAFMGELREKSVVRSPSSYFASNVFVTFFDDLHGLRNLDAIGADNVLVETDYPHSATTWPNSLDVVHEQATTAGLGEQDIHKITNGNARRLFRLG